ncbi:hypothetical protein L1987_86969 [Smallanthus sonchifolius]|uniref:Uncharacterized protein n=1 Tax=Smallanthus sonchifolius TaxID=185202 RepID=A0ACB8Y2B6_9ASTR|nr:hypothetical protein L1987_86969 [Smallanthus sonchifolius]
MKPHGGKMDEFEETRIPYPYRKGYLYNLQYYEKWDDGSVESSEKHVSWMRRMYENMTPYVSKNPRGAYVNYRDLDLGLNDNEIGNGEGVVDPDNFFYFEQSIPPLGDGSIESYQRSKARSMFL